VVLKRVADASAEKESLGFEVVDYRVKCRESLGIDIGSELLLITQVFGTGLLAQWNTSQPDCEVQEGDLIVDIKGSRVDASLLLTCRKAEQLLLDSSNATEILLQVVRPHRSFNARLHKTGPSLGLGFRNPRGARLLISDVLAEGAVAEYNAAENNAGRWDRLILPGMVVRAVNGIDGDFDRIREELASCQVVELQVQHAGADVPVTPPTWEVVLTEQETAVTVPEVGWLGFEVQNFSDECHAQLGVDIGTSVVLVSYIAPGGCLARWNQEWSDKEVLQGDRVLEVNGTCKAEEILAALQNPLSFPLRLRFARPPWYFNARVKRNGMPLGLAFRKSQGASNQRLLITEVSPDGAVAEYNSAQLAAGQWELLIVPGMLIKAVNGCEGDWETFSTSDIINLQMLSTRRGLLGRTSSASSFLSNEASEKLLTPVEADDEQHTALELVKGESTAGQSPFVPLPDEVLPVPPAEVPAEPPLPPPDTNPPSLPGGSDLHNLDDE
jgi:hypothetical protein